MSAGKCLTTHLDTVTVTCVYQLYLAVLILIPVNISVQECYGVLNGNTAYLTGL